MFTLPAVTLTMPEVVKAMKGATEEVGMSSNFQITFGEDDVPFICHIEYAKVLQAFPNMPQTEFKSAVVETLKTFQSHAQKGWITAADVV